MLKRTWMWAVPLLILSASPLHAAEKGKYISLFYGVASSSADVSAVDSVDGSVMGAAFGFQLSPKFALELMARKTSFDAKSATLDLSAYGLGTLNTTSEMNALFIGPGLRLAFFKFLNVHFGLGYATLDPKFTISGSGSLAGTNISVEKESGLGLYYGAGIQIPISKIDIIADYTINQMSSDIGSNEITGGLRLRF